MIFIKTEVRKFVFNELTNGTFQKIQPIYFILLYLQEVDNFFL